MDAGIGHVTMLKASQCRMPCPCQRLKKKKKKSALSHAVMFVFIDYISAQ